MTRMDRRLWHLLLPALALVALQACGRTIHDASRDLITSDQRPRIQPQPQVAFDRYEVVIDSTERQTVLTGFLLGGAPETEEAASA